MAWVSSSNFFQILPLTLAGLLALAVPASADDIYGKPFLEMNPADFEPLAPIDNPFMPLKPGTRWIQEGSSVDEGERVEHRIEFTVTDLVKVINGVPTTVVWIVDYSQGDELVEREVAFYAQAKDGTVWYLGEHPEAFEDGELVEAPTWIVGVQDARAGIAMPADPKVGDGDYAQGWAPAVGWEDRAQVYKMGESVTVPAGTFDDVLIMDEFTAKEPGFKLKYYARGFGPVSVGWRGEGDQQETLELTKKEMLTPEQMDEIRQLALDLEANAYKISPDVYGTTPPSEKRSE